LPGLPTMVIVEWSPCSYLSPWGFHLIYSPCPAELEWERLGGYLVASWCYPTTARLIQYVTEYSVCTL